LILSVDAGTTASKISLFNERGELLGISTQEYPLMTPSPLDVEIEAETLWYAFKNGVAEVVKRSQVNPADISSIGISAQGETLILVDEEGNALRRAFVWLDNRAQKEADELDREFNDGSSFKVTGQVKIVPTWPASKILWVKHHEPEIFDNVHKYLLVEDYLIAKMTGRYVAEGSQLCSTSYWNIITKTWWDEMLDYLGVTVDQLPEILESGEAVAEVKRDIASELGLSSRTIVCTGALDQAAGAIGVGNIHPGIFSENTGAALAICAPLRQPIFDHKRRMPIHYFAIPDMYMAHTFTTGGMVLRWFRDNFCSEELTVGSRTGIDPYGILDQEAARVEAGSEGLVMLPHLQGAMAPEANPKATGVFYGFTLRHTKAHFVRAIMEAIACIVKRNVEVLENMNVKVEEIRVLGGGARSKIWNQIKADLIGKPVLSTENEEAACLGAAILAGSATGVYGSVEKACKDMVKIKDRFTPNIANSKVYQGTYANYVRLYHDLTDMYGNGSS
jgi:xylulokinase